MDASAYQEAATLMRLPDVNASVNSVLALISIPAQIAPDVCAQHNMQQLLLQMLTASSVNTDCAILHGTSGLLLLFFCLAAATGRSQGIC